MFREHHFVVWGTRCRCGMECGILQNQHHPWTETESVVKLHCPACGRAVYIDRNCAAAFYDGKINSYFENLYGTVVDFGCGGGFLSRHLIRQSKIDRVIGLDVENCADEISDLMKDGRFEFRSCGGSDLNGALGGVKTDFLVSRDVFMFLEDTGGYFDAVSRNVQKGIRQMGWYQKSNGRMKNRLEPCKIAEEYEKRGWNVRLENLDWYASGYFISADKSSS